MAHQVSGKGLAVSRVLVASLLTSHPMRSLPPPSALKVRLHMMRYSKSSDMVVSRRRLRSAFLAYMEFSLCGRISKMIDSVTFCQESISWENITSWRKIQVQVGRGHIPM